LYASAREARAFGRSNEVSRFTEALIQALGSNGADRRQGRWQVSTASLAQAVIKRVEFGNGEGVPAQDCVSDGESASTTTLHVLDSAPAIPALVKTANPMYATAGLEFWRGLPTDTEPDQSIAGPSPWRFDVPAGTYSVRAMNGTAVLGTLDDEWVLPPAYERDMP
jgi:hypothetical protein